MEEIPSLVGDIDNCITLSQVENLLVNCFAVREYCLSFAPPISGAEGDGGGRRNSGNAWKPGRRTADLSRGKGDDLANETDFLDLYRRLKLSPGCGLPELKQAYRRHVALLHPDRRGGTYLDARAAELLQRLTAQYRAAMAFQRRHGRLPGAIAESRAAVSETIVPIPRHRPAPPGAARRSHAKMFSLLALLATASFLLSITSLSSSPEPAPIPEDANEEAGQPESVATQTLSFGMSPESVRAIEGDPEAIHDGRWDYGPSWISFDHGEVVDWHSSPLRSLKVTSSRPPNRRP